MLYAVLLLTCSTIEPTTPVYTNGASRSQKKSTSIRCGVRKPETDFYSTNGTPDKRRTRCNGCVNGATIRSNVRTAMYPPSDEDEEEDEEETEDLSLLVADLIRAR